MTSPMIETLAGLVNTELDTLWRAHAEREHALKAEILKLERQAGNLARFLAEGGHSVTVREELHAVEAALQGLRLELAQLQQAADTPPAVHPARIGAKLGRLDILLREDPLRAKAEVAKHWMGN
jgi:hypothetical protein